MARFEYRNSLGDYGRVGDFLDENNLSPDVQNSIVATYLDPQGDGLSMIGTGLIYAGLTPIGGTMTSLEFFSSSGAPLLTVTGLHTSVAAAYQIFSLTGLEAMILSLTFGDDVFVGSDRADILESGKGNDTLRGGEGADIIHGSKGTDLMTGGRGIDTFLFIAGDGTDTITDFRDTGGASDDLISITRKMYNTMVVVETATGVDLQFGLKGTLSVTGWHVADIGTSDFLLA